MGILLMSASSGSPSGRTISMNLWRKRGMLENGLILGTFASVHVPNMEEEELVLYDRLINLPSNDWEIYYWATGVKETPEEFDNKVMDALKEHTKNRGKEVRNQLPELNYKPVSF